MKAHQGTIGKSDEWLTPRWIMDPLGEFDLDPCSPVDRPWSTAKHHFTVKENGLENDWFGRVWCNPPFHRYKRPEWMRRMAEHNNGIMLVPAAGETKAFADYVWGKCAGILILNCRPKFCYVDGSASAANSGCTISLIAYGHKNFDLLKQSGLGVALREA